MPKISVIVPVYKAEAYLHRCVDSLLAQTFRDFEVLLVDDGSPDRSGAICDEYASRDSRVRALHKPNGGVSSARQYGLDNALGDYTIHADPDDWVEPDMLEALYAKAIAEDADLVICDFYVERNGTQTYRKQQPSALDHETVLRELFQQLHGSCCNKLVRRACYKTFDVRFPQNFSFCEDVYVNTSLLVHNIRIAYLPKAFYHYTTDINTNSIVNRYNKEIQQQDLQLYHSLDKLLSNTSAYDVFRKHEAFTITLRAFHAHIDTSKSFKEKYHQFREPISKNKNIGLFHKSILCLSCVGFYPLAYHSFNTIMAVYNKCHRLSPLTNK